MADVFNLFYPVCSDIQSCQLFLKKEREERLNMYIQELNYSGADKNKTTDVTTDQNTDRKGAVEEIFRIAGET